MVEAFVLCVVDTLSLPVVMTELILPCSVVVTVCMVLRCRLLSVAVSEVDVVPVVMVRLRIHAVTLIDTGGFPLQKPVITAVDPCTVLFVVAEPANLKYCNEWKIYTVSTILHYAFGSHAEDYSTDAFSDRCGSELTSSVAGSITCCGVTLVFTVGVFESTKSPHCAASVFDCTNDDSLSSSPP